MLRQATDSDHRNYNLGRDAFSWSRKMISVYERVLADRSSLMRRLPELCIHVSSDITGILVQMIDDPSTCPLPYYRAPNTDD